MRETLTPDPSPRGRGGATRRAAFLDRDGVINVDLGYVHRIEDFEFVPGTLEACRELVRRGWLLVVATNQSGIGRGLYTVQDFHALTDWMRAHFEQSGAPLAGVYYCPHHPTDAMDAFRVRCNCRKPQAGMLLQAAQDLSVDLARSILFGDKAEDLLAAQVAGIGHRILLGKDGHVPPRGDRAPGLATARFTSLRDAVASQDLAPILGEAVDA